MYNFSPSSGWKEVVNLLSGQFCASFNFIDSTASVQPKFSFRPEGFADPNNIRNDSVFYAALPTETVCTENLTPWKKLLPCFAKSGLATLLNAVHVFNSNYFSLALDLRPVCKVINPGYFSDLSRIFLGFISEKLFFNPQNFPD